MTGFVTQIVDASARGALVLTANKRLARHLRRSYDLRMQSEERTVWQSPQIISYEAWLHRCLNDAGEGWRLLNGSAALRLWEELIEESSAGSELELLQVPATARKALEAHRLLGEYRCSLAGANLTEDHCIFQQWQERFRQVCHDKNWIDRSDLPRHALDIFSDGGGTLPPEVFLAGFDQWSPEFDELKEAFGLRGVGFREVLPEPDPAARVGKAPCVDAENEIEMAARWARRLLEEGAGSIGIVVLDLHARRSKIERIFRDQIDPGAALAPGGEEEVFSLSLGEPLSDQGPVYAALELLSLSHRPSLEQVSFLLRTPYLAGSQSESDRRSLFDRTLRRSRQQNLSREKLVRMAENATPVFASVLVKLARRKTSRCLPGEWAGRFDRMLEDIGWPGERIVSSREYQVVKAWREKLLPAMASLDPVSSPMGEGEAVALMRRLAGEIEFQVESETGPVQVLGLLESAGLEFDHLWVAGMNEDAFPAPSRPNPFIPLTMQVEKQMPHSSAARELLFARRILQRLLAASPDIVFSYAVRRGDCELRPTPLLEDFEEIEAPAARSRDPKRQMADQLPTLSEVVDTQGPELTLDLAEGGTGTLKDQSLCPFRAFAHYRLKCQALDRPEAGIDAMTRGTLLHKALETFWNDLQSSDRLMTRDDAALRGLVEQHVAAAVNDCFKDRPSPDPRLLDLEGQRLCALIVEWLAEVEMQRPAFRVEKIEEHRLEQIGPMKIRTVVDRIDRLTDGTRVILDYKTGQVKPDKLLGERLLEPQLPIYAAEAGQGGAEAVAFARVRRGECRFVGVAAGVGLLPKVAAVGESSTAQSLGIVDWPQLLLHWHTQLEALAADFASGAAAVDPASFEDACRYCDLTAFCRIAEGRYKGNDDDHTDS
ncbi:MAG TPA: PD-(D/E)XK nuclease family protein [Desulfuromonadales bacterium]|nr:PD-(D/E)XK nuclease family protein [Desulfuromonadales bacterium]